jgi:hypothetical protein
VECLDLDFIAATASAVRVEWAKRKKVVYSCVNRPIIPNIPLDSPSLGSPLRQPEENDTTRFIRFIVPFVSLRIFLLFRFHPHSLVSSLPAPFDFFHSALNAMDNPLA